MHRIFWIFALATMCMFISAEAGLAASVLVKWNPPGDGGTSVDGLYHVTNVNDGLALYNTDYFSNTYPTAAPVTAFTPGFAIGDAVGLGRASVRNYGAIDITFPATYLIDIHVLSLDGLALEFDTGLPQNSGLTPQVLSSVHMRAEAFSPVGGVFTFGDDALPGDQTANNEFQAAAGTIRFTSASPFSTLRFEGIPGYNMEDNGDGANLAITEITTAAVPAPAAVWCGAALLGAAWAGRVVRRGGRQMRG